jgi:hypothetical protein
MVLCQAIRSGISTGESRLERTAEVEVDDSEDVDRMDHMLEDLQPELAPDHHDSPTPEVQKFFDLLKASEEPLHGHTYVTVLEFVTRLMSIKSKFAFSINCYKELMDLISKVLPTGHKMPKDMYQYKKLLEGLGMEYEKIDVCQDNCMLFWKEHGREQKCLKCGKSRYVELVNKDGEKVVTKVAHKQLRYMPLTPRVKHLFLSRKTAMHMRWHKDCMDRQDGLMVHPSDGDAWNALDNFDPEFASDTINVRIGLATDGFTPFNMTAALYSCWSVIVIPYNLPPALCMKYEFMFLCLVIPGPKHPSVRLNVMLQPLIEELKKLWQGVEAYDCFKKQNFNLCVAYLFSVHEFMAYGIFSGWSVHGRLTCPYCAKDTNCFCLSAGGKICYFDCHRCFLPFNHPFRRQRKEFRKGTITTKGPPKRRSGIEITEEHRKLVLDESGKKYQGFGEEHNWTHICGLWELPYAKSLILMHNIDVMHQESNFCQALINTCMDFPDKTKDNDKACMDLAVICDRSTQVLRENRGKPKADYCLKPKQRKEVMKWMKDLKFPDGYATGFRRSMNLKTMKMNGLKSHDFHIYYGKAHACNVSWVHFRCCVENVS